MNFIVLSDLHFYRNSKKSLPTENGLTTWVKTQLQVFESILDQYVNTDIDTVILNGDIFEEKNNINQTLYNAVWNSITKYSIQFERFIINVGNHDTLTVASNSSLSPFSKNCIVVTEPTDFEEDNTFIRVIPYSQVNEESLKIPKTKKAKFLFTHEHIDGLTWGSTEYWKPSDLKSSAFRGWDKVFNGHIHKHQELKPNIINIGSLMQSDFGELGEDKYYIEYKDKKIIKHVIEGGIQHLYYNKINRKTIKEIEDDNTNIIKVRIPPTMMEESWVKKYNVFPEYEKPKNRETRIKEEQKIEDDIKMWVELNNTDLNSNKLIQLGMELIN